MGTEETQQMSKIRVAKDSEIDKPAGFFRETTLDLLYYALLVAVIGAAIIATGYIIVEYIVPFLARALTYPVEAGVVVAIASILSFYAGAFRKKRGE